MLKRLGAEVTSVASSAEALSAFAQRLPDLVISDIGMAEEDGYELMRKIRTLEVEGEGLMPATRGGTSAERAGLLNIHRSSRISHHLSIVPAIALTGYATRKDRARALSAGYQLHLAKPVEPEELVAAIARLVGQRH
jgi:CheY-like chemotaxis protein